MYNEMLDAEVKSASVFRFGEGDDIRHGVTVKCEIETTDPEHLEDCVLDFTGAKTLFSSKQLVDGEVKLQFERKSAMTAAFAILKPRSVELEEIAMSPGESISFKLKFSDVPEAVLGAICARLGLETRIKLVPTQTEMEFKDEKKRKK